MADDIKKRKAVAIKYDRGDIAPKVVAKGSGYVADRIIEKADGVTPIYKDEKLVKELSEVDIGSNIPKELYQVVAEVLVFISDLDKLERYKKHGND